MPLDGEMPNGSEFSFNFLSSAVNDAGYFGVLLVYDSLAQDHWVLAARTLNKAHSFKYIVAIRTYAISPEYCSMICKSFDLIQKDRIALNIVAGNISDEEECLDNIVWLSEALDTKEKRIIYTNNWVKKFMSIKNFKDKPYIIVAGESDKAIETADLNANDQLFMLSRYKKNLVGRIQAGVMVSVPVIIGGTNREAKQKFIEKWQDNETMSESCIYGNEDSVVEQIKALSKIGVEHVLVSSPIEDDFEMVHKMSKRLILEMSNASV